MHLCHCRHFRPFSAYFRSFRAIFGHFGHFGHLLPPFRPVSASFGRCQPLSVIFGHVSPPLRPIFDQFGLFSVQLRSQCDQIRALRTIFIFDTILSSFGYGRPFSAIFGHLFQFPAIFDHFSVYFRPIYGATLAIFGPFMAHLRPFRSSFGHFP